MQVGTEVVEVGDVVVAVVVVAAVLAGKPCRLALQVRRLVLLLVFPVAAELLLLGDGLDVLAAQDDGSADLHRVGVVVAPAIERVELGVGDGALVTHVVTAVGVHDDERAMEPLVGVLSGEHRARARLLAAREGVRHLEHGEVEHVAIVVAVDGFLSAEFGSELAKRGHQGLLA